MPFKPVKQISTILKQQYFEPTISWSLRVVLALNVPLIVIPIFKGFSFEVIWSAFGAYMLSLIDYRGLHYRKIIIQLITALLVFLASVAGMYVTHSVGLSVAGMFVVGLFAAIIRNWRDYGPSIAVSVGFFFLFGLAVPVSFHESLTYGAYLLTGCAWAVIITLVSFPFQPSNPVRRSVAGIWKANTDLLDTMVKKLVDDKAVSLQQITEKELAVRKAIDQSRNLFAIRDKRGGPKTRHYDQMMELRRTASLFTATLSSMHEELEMINTRLLPAHPDVSFYKTLSALAQASARVSIVIFTLRPDDLAVARVRLKRCEATVSLFTGLAGELKAQDHEKRALRHFVETLQQSLGVLQQSLQLVEEKLGLEKSDYFENYKLSFYEFVSGLKPEALGDFFSELLRVNPQQLQYALRVAMGLAFGVFLYQFFKIDHGYWIPLTMLIVIQPYYGATFKKGLERITGTVAGIITGGLIMLLPLPHEAFVGFLIVDSFFVAYFLRNNYKVGVFFVTIMMVLLMQLSQQASWALIGWRILSTLLGALLALAAGYALWPVWEKQRFPALLAKALEQNRHYLLHTLRYLQKELPPGDSWQKYRRLAESANNEAFASVQRMQQEPEHARYPGDTGFALVGVCVRISREITSVALTAGKNKLNDETQALIAFYEQAANLFGTFSQSVGDMQPLKAPPDFGPVKKSLDHPFFRHTEGLSVIRAELEKMVFELEAMAVMLGQMKH